LPEGEKGGHWYTVQYSFLGSLLYVLDKHEVGEWGVKEIPLPYLAPSEIAIRRVSSQRRRREGDYANYSV
jgi:hypothetical protein